MQDTENNLRERPPDAAIVIAQSASMHSECLSKRGVSIWNAEGAVIANDYNRKLPGFACTSNDICKQSCRIDAIHAEQGALLALGRNARGMEMLHVKTVRGEIVHSGPPSCVQCSKLIVAAGIAGMWLYHELGWQRYPADEFHRLSLNNAK